MSVESCGALLCMCMYGEVSFLFGGSIDAHGIMHENAAYASPLVRGGGGVTLAKASERELRHRVVVHGEGREVQFE